MKRLVVAICMILLALGCSDGDPTFGTPTNMQVTGVTENAVGLSWEDKSFNETGFRIECAIAGEDFSTVHETDADVESFTDEDVVQGVIYTYRVCAFNGEKRSGYSNVASTESFVSSASLPISPENLQSSTVTATSLVLTWVDRSDNETGFEIDRSLQDDFSDVDTYVTDTNEARFEDSALTAETPYYYRVRAINGAGASEYCQPLSVQTTAVPVTPPVAPSNLGAEAVSSSGIELTWQNNSDNAEGIILFVSLDGVDFEELHTGDATARAYAHEGLSSQTTYYYKMLAFNSAGRSDETDVVEARTPMTPASAPDTPQELTYSELTNNSVRLSWADMSDDEEGFRLEKSRSQDFSVVESFTLDPGTETYQDVQLLASTDYYYRVVAFNQIGDSEYSDTVEFRTHDEEIDLPAPSSLGLQEATSSSITIGWQQNSDNEEGFHVEYSRDGGQTFNPAGTTGTDQTTFTHTELASNATYHYRVNAYNGNQTSAFSNTIEARTAVGPQPTGNFIADHIIAKEGVLRRIPVSAINAAKEHLNIMYCGTSHSSQVVDGMRGLMEYKTGDGTLFNTTFNGTATSGALNIDYRPGSVYYSRIDLGYDSTDSEGHTEYFRRTVTYLDATLDCNVVMWSWCNIGGHDVDTYLNNFSALIDMYRAGGSQGRTAQNAVTFVFMTGWASGSDDTPEPPYTRTAYQNHKRIVDYCKANGYFCLDYWSQDTYNYGDDSYKPTENGNSNAQHLAWVNEPANELGSQWFQCRNYRNGSVHLPAHANQHLTGNRRAYAAWWIFARVAGWDGTLE